MYRPFHSLPLSRRLPAYLLVCGLGGLAALLSGLTLGLSAETDSERELTLSVTALHDRLAEDAALRGGRDAAVLLRAFCAEERILFCGVLDAAGNYVAHSNPQRVGAASDSPSPLGPDSRAQARVAFESGPSGVAEELWMPLRYRGRLHGLLQVGVGRPAAGHRLRRVLERAPVALLAPLALLVIGAGAVRRAVEPASAIEDQLRRYGDGEAAPLEPVAGAAGAVQGWNKVVEQARRAERGPGLAGRLGELLGGARERRADRVLTALPEGVAATDSEGTVTFANGAFAALLGTADAEALTGRPIAALFAALSPNAADALAADADGLGAAGLRPTVTELRLGTELSDGVLRVAQTPLSEPDGRPGLRIWTLRDVTQQKLADAMRTDFLNSATHELRTPLANIKAYAETLSLADDIEPEQQKDFCNTINEEATRLARFVDELLDISRIEAGGLTVARGEVDFQRLLAECAQKVQAQIAQKGLRFEQRVPAKLPALKADKDALAAALVNLLSNAVKYTPDGGAVTLAVEQEGRELRVHVEDSGIGIPADELPRLFKKFFRGADPRVRAVTGTGLGLAYSHEVFRLHGGSLSCVSEPDRGSRFTATLSV